MTSKTITAGAYASAVVLSLALPRAALAQAAPAAAPAAPATSDEEIVVLSPFEVTTEQTSGYVATTTMAGSRINTELKDVGSAISVVTPEFLRDTGATNNQTLLQYTTSTEVGSVGGNFTNARNSRTQDEGPTFANPNTNTRVRGLAAADNTRNFFLTEIPWDSYNVDRIDMQRGPNSILFGMGSPAGIIDSTTKTAQFRNFGEVETRYGSYGTNRVSLDYNQTLLPGELGVRVAAVRDDTKYKQDPAHSLSKRVYAAMRWEPKFLNKGRHRTVVKASIEAGEVDSNNPRVITPVDYITPWFTTMGRAAYNPNTVQDNNALYRDDQSTYYPGDRGEAILRLQSGEINPVYQPWLGNFAQSFGGPLAIFDQAGGSPRYVLSEFSNYYGINSSGGIDKGIGGLNYSRRVAVGQFSNVASNLRLPYWDAGVYKDNTLSDASVFDFYNQMLDGANKSETQDFKNFNLSVSQMFFDQRFGIEAAYDYQEYKNGSLGILDASKAGLYVDMNANDIDGTANPNFGRAFISDATQYGNNHRVSERESWRVTAFATHDFNKARDGNWVKKLLGRHVVTGVLSHDSSQADARGFLRYGTDDTYRALVSGTGLKTTDNLRLINRVVYLGPTLKDRATASGAAIPAPDRLPDITSGTIHLFDSHWNSSVDPAAAWRNPYNNQDTTQSENPANYVGWSNAPFGFVDSEDGHRDELTFRAQQTRTRVATKAVVLQSFLWDGAVVGMWGVRNDHLKNWNLGPVASGATGLVSVDPATYTLTGRDPVIEEDNTVTWSVVAHLNKFIGPRAPFNVSVFYNESENFQPGAGRVDIYNQPLAAPSGRTNDRGVIISTKDERFSLKVNKYETKMYGASTSLDGTWFLNAVESWGANWANIIEYNYSGNVHESPGTGPNWRTQYAPDFGETAAQAAARETAAIAGWRAHQAHVPQVYWTTMGLSPTNLDANQSGSLPPGFTATEDVVSKGWEFEFTASPIKNWRVTFNATKAEASRSNIGGKALAEFVSLVNTDLATTPAGDLRIWGAGAGNTTILREWRNTFYTSYASLVANEGTATPEMRKWRFNLVTNYDFSTGFLKGVNVGVGYRWQAKVAIGYPVKTIPGSASVVYDMANPYYGPSEDAIDLWLGYSRKLTSKIDWHVQLNIRNLGDGNGLIPLTTQPDGSIAAWRIAPTQTWQLTNTFKF